MWRYIWPKEKRHDRGNRLHSDKTTRFHQKWRQRRETCRSQTDTSVVQPGRWERFKSWLLQGACPISTYIDVVSIYFDLGGETSSTLSLILNIQRIYKKLLWITELDQTKNEFWNFTQVFQEFWIEHNIFCLDDILFIKLWDL